jgi:hypothetical protein
MSFILRVLYTIVCFTAPLVGAEQHERIHLRRILGDLDFIKNTFEMGYAPAEWKISYLDWDLESEYTTARSKVLENPFLTEKDFHRVIRDFIRSTRDYHVTISFFSTEKSRLPFRVLGANGRYFLTYVDRKVLSDIFKEIPISEGDELLMMDGVPIEKIITELN